MINKQETMVKWTKRQRELLHGVRNPHKKDPEQLAFSAATGWYSLKRHHLSLQKRVTVTAEPAYQDLVQSIFDAYKSPNPPRDLTLEQEIMRMILALKLYKYEVCGVTKHPGIIMPFLLGLWIDHSGIQLVLDIYQTATPYTTSGSFSYSSQEIHFKKANPTHWAEMPFQLMTQYSNRAFWQALRSKLFTLNEKDFTVEKQKAQKVRDLFLSQGKEGFKHANYLAFAFARDPQWAEEDIRSDLGRSGDVYYGTLEAELLASTTNPELALEYVEKWGSSIPTNLYNYIYDIVEALGAESEPVFEAILRKNLDSKNKRKFQAGLKLSRKRV